MSIQNDIEAILSGAINSINSIDCRSGIIVGGGGGTGCENQTPVINTFTHDATKLVLNPLRGVNAFSAKNAADHPVSASGHNRGQAGTVYSTYWGDLWNGSSYDFDFVEQTMVEMLTHANNYPPGIDSAIPTSSGEDVRGRMKIGYRFIADTLPGSAPIVPGFVVTKAGPNTCGGTVVDWDVQTNLTYHNEMLADFKTFIETPMAALGGDKPVKYIEWIDIGSVGYAGEWTYQGCDGPTPEGLPSITNCMAIVDQYINNFQGSGTPVYLIALVAGMRRHPDGFTSTPIWTEGIELINYTLRNGNVGWRQDCFGCPSFEGDICNLLDRSTVFRNTWKTAPVIREVCGTWTLWPGTGGECTSVLGNGTESFGGECGDLTFDTYSDLFSILKDNLHGAMIQGLTPISDATLKSEINSHVLDLGARLCITSVSAQTEINTNGPTPISVTFTNYGSSPNFALEQYSLELTGGGGTGTSTVPPVLPGESKTVQVVVVGASAGTHAMNARVVDRSDIEIELANQDAIESTDFNYDIGNQTFVTCV